MTGHRPNKLGGFDAESKKIIKDFAISTLKQIKPSKIITGCSLGWDIAIASACVDLGIPFVAAIPFKKQFTKWYRDDIDFYSLILSKATQVIYIDTLEGFQVNGVSVGEYAVDKLHNRNKWMVDNSDKILALWRPGEPGGTKNCVDYAKKKYKFPQEQIIHVWENYLEYRESIGKPFVNDVLDENGVLVVDVVEEANSSYVRDNNDESTDELSDEIADALLGEYKNEIVYPYQINPDLEFSPYNAVYNDGKKIHVDEDYLKRYLNWKPTFDYKSCDWEPRRVPDYRHAKLLMLDIETLGLNPKDRDSRIVMIGLLAQGNFLGNSKVSKDGFEKLSKGHIIQLQENTDDAEREILAGLFRLIDALQPDAIITHNGFDFDFPYIIERCEMLGVNHPMTRITDKPRRITAASIYGQIPEYFPVYWTKPGRNGRVYNDGSFPQLIDTLHLAGQHDKIFANMQKYSLKYLAHYTGFRKEKRLEIGDKVREYWLSGETEKIEDLRKYLIYDLEDQQAVSNFFLVSSWYQQMYFPLPLQEICVASPARKHNANLESYYRKHYDKKISFSDGSSKYFSRPVADEKVGYEGAIVSVNSGIYRRFFKLDFSSMYPSIMLRYVLMSQEKDPKGVFLNTIETLRSLRYVYKNLGGDDPHKAKSIQAYKDFPYLFDHIDFDNISKEDKKIFKGVDNSLKVGINGGYGFLGVGFYNFNDIFSAALVTAYGRIMLKECIAISKQYCNIIECLAPETLVLTDKGYYPIVELEGKEVKVLNGNCVWSNVKFFSTSEDYLYEITFKRYTKTITIRCNGTHKWLVKPTQTDKIEQIEKFVTTEELHTIIENEAYKKYCVRKNVVRKLPDALMTVDEYPEYIHGVIHGITYSDGYLCKKNTNGTYAHVLQLVGNKRELGKYIDIAYKRFDFMLFHNSSVDQRRDDSFVHRFTTTKNLKELPSLENSKMYLLGFVRGMIAGDGSVSKKDGCFDVSGLKETCEFIDKIAHLVGFETTRINKSNSKGRSTLIRNKVCTSKTDTYKVFFSCNNATDEDFLRSFHKNSFIEGKQGKPTRNPGWSIVSVKKTNTKEVLYCCTEPSTHRFTLQGGIDTGNCDSDGLFLQPKKINEVDESLLKEKYTHPRKNYIISPELDGYVNPEYVWMTLEKAMPEGMAIDLETNCPEGAIYAPAMKNYIFWESPTKEPKLKGVYRKRNRTELQKKFPIEFIRLWAFEGKQQAHKYANEIIEKLTGFKVCNKNILLSATIEDPKKLKGEDKKKHKLFLDSNCGEIGETIEYYWGERQHYTSGGRKNGKKAFPIRRYRDSRVPNNQEFPCDEKDVNKNINIEKYVANLETKVIPYSQKDNLNELLDMDLISKIMFTQRIPKRQFNKNTGEPQKSILLDYGMGSIGDSVSFYWGSITTPNASEKTGKTTYKTDRFPVRIVINDDDSIRIDVQNLPDDIDTNMINLNINVAWYLEDFLKIRNEILEVVDK